MCKNGWYLPVSLVQPYWDVVEPYNWLVFVTYMSHTSDHIKQSSYYLFTLVGWYLPVSLVQPHWDVVEPYNGLYLWPTWVAHLIVWKKAAMTFLLGWLIFTCEPGAAILRCCRAIQLACICDFIDSHIWACKSFISWASATKVAYSFFTCCNRRVNSPGFNCKRVHDINSRQDSIIGTNVIWSTKICWNLQILIKIQPNKADSFFVSYCFGKPSIAVIFGTNWPNSIGSVERGGFAKDV